MPSSYAVGEHFERFINEQVEAGHYACASEVVRDALRFLEETMGVLHRGAFCSGPQLAQVQPPTASRDDHQERHGR